jgi:hypothetical protein
MRSDVSSGRDTGRVGSRCRVTSLWFFDAALWWCGQVIAVSLAWNFGSATWRFVVFAGRRRVRIYDSARDWQVLVDEQS